MSDEETKSVEHPDAQANLEATESNVQNERQASPDDLKKRNAEEVNWAEARRKMQDLERRNEELSNAVRQLQPKAPEPVEDELDKLGDDELLTKAQSKKLGRKIAKEELAEAMRQYTASTVEERVKVKFPDYDEVVNKENIETLKKLKPELALSLAHNPDPYAQAVAVYDALKMVGMGKDDPARLEKDRAAKNAQKPVSVNAVTKNSAIGNAHIFENGLTPELKKSLWNEMKQAMKQA